jgi:hypothetical protein
MDELVQFLRDRLNEDERYARATTERQPYDEWDAVGAGGDDDVAQSWWEVAKIARMERSPAARALAQHIARHDPARVLRDIEAKRDLLRVAERAHDYHETFTSGFASALEGVLRLFAVAYAEHPDYRAEWRP